jgi:diacylglycerol kinase
MKRWPDATVLPLGEEPAEEPRQRVRRPWRHKFRDALRGMKLGIRGHSSFFVHFFLTALTLAGAVVLRCSIEQWGLLLLAVGLVLTAELFNSAIETLFRGLDEMTREQCWPALDIAAGAVLLASVTAALIGILVFAHRLLFLTGWL